jgi:parallel beta-helix repeat protein
VVVVVLSLFSSPARATDYYVATTGNDLNSGISVDAPLLTPQRCAEIATAGDVCHFRGGTYESSSTMLALTRSGTDRAPISFRNYASERPVFSVSRSTPDTCAISLYGSSWIAIEGLTVVGGDYGIVLDAGSSHSQILNNDVSLGYLGGIRIGTRSSDNLIKGNRIFDNGRINWPRGAAPPAAGAMGSGVSVGAESNGNLFEDNYIYWNHGEGVVFGAHSSNTAHRNVIADNWSENVVVGSGNNVVDGNLIYLSDAAKSWLDARDDNRSNADGIVVSIESAKASGNLQLVNNIIVNALSCIRARIRGKDPRLWAGLWTVSNNTCVSNDTGIAIMDGAFVSRLVVQNNILIDKGAGSSMVEIHAAPGSSILRNNVYGSFDPRAFHWMDREPRSFAGWVSVSGEHDSSTRDPFLKAPATIPPRLWDDADGLGPGSPAADLSIEPFAPQELSPAIDAGVDTITPFVRGHHGSHRDIGALEYCIAGAMERNDTDNAADAQVPACQATPNESFLPSADMPRLKLRTSSR